MHVKTEGHIVEGQELCVMCTKARKKRRRDKESKE
jgi:hypothetical protein